MHTKDADTTNREIALENREWIESLDYVYENQGPERVLDLLRLLQVRAQQKGTQACTRAMPCQLDKATRRPL